MAKTLPISATKSYFLPVRNASIKGVALCAAAASSVLEVFDGVIDAVATYNFPNAGTGYAVGDLVTLVAGENGTSESRAILRVTQVDNLSPSSSVSSSPSSSISLSPSESSSPSSSASPSTSISSSPSPSSSPSISISSSPSSSASPSTCISSSPSSSISSSVSLSPSPSVSPSAGNGEITAAEIIFTGGGYTASNTYATTTDGSGADATVKVLTVSDVGDSIAKLACVANESAPPFISDCGALTTKGISVRISGTSAKGHITYE